MAMILTTGIRRQPALGPLRTKLNSRHRQHRSSRRLHGCSTSIFPRPTLRLRMLSPRILHSPRGRDLGPEPRRRPPGRRFVLHGLSGLESGMLPSNPALCDLSNAICCCCCAPPRRYPGSCRTHHHHPSPGHSQTSISSLLTRPLAVCASFVPSPCALCAGLMRRLKRPLRPQGRLTGRREERRRRPQRARRRRRRFGRSDGRWRQCARPFGRLVRPSEGEAAAEQQQQQQ